MNFDQGEFNFANGGGGEGFRKWLRELEKKQRAFEARWGVILSRHIIIPLKNHANPLEGRLKIVSSHKHGQPVFRVRGLEFTTGEIESLIQAETPAPPSL